MDCRPLAVVICLPCTDPLVGICGGIFGGTACNARHGDLLFVANGERESGERRQIGIEQNNQNRQPNFQTQKKYIKL